MSDNFPNLNFYAGGEVHGPGGYDKPSEGLLRGVEFVATYFSYAVASDALGGKVDEAEPSDRLLRAVARRRRRPPAR